MCASRTYFTENFELTFLVKFPESVEVFWMPASVSTCINHQNMNKCNNDVTHLKVNQDALWYICKWTIFLGTTLHLIGQSIDFKKIESIIKLEEKYFQRAKSCMSIGWQLRAINDATTVLNKKQEITTTHQYFQWWYFQYYRFWII